MYPTIAKLSTGIHLSIDDPSSRSSEEIGEISPHIIQQIKARKTTQTLQG